MQKMCGVKAMLMCFGALLMPSLSTLGSIISASFLSYSAKAWSQMWLQSQLAGMCRCSASEELISDTLHAYPKIQYRGSLRIHLTQKWEFSKILKCVKILSQFSSLSKKKKKKA